MILIYFIRIGVIHFSVLRYFPTVTAAAPARLGRITCSRTRTRHSTGHHARRSRMQSEGGSLFLLCHSRTSTRHARARPIVMRRLRRSARPPPTACRVRRYRTDSTDRTAGHHAHRLHAWGRGKLLLLCHPHRPAPSTRAGTIVMPPARRCARVAHEACEVCCSSQGARLAHAHFP